jgi:hypothetical protein
LSTLFFAFFYLFAPFPGFVFLMEKYGVNWPLESADMSPQDRRRKKAAPFSALTGN